MAKSNPHFKLQQTSVDTIEAIFAFAVFRGKSWLHLDFSMPNSQCHQTRSNSEISNLKIARRWTAHPLGGEINTEILWTRRKDEPRAYGTPNYECCTTGRPSKRTSTHPLIRWLNWANAQELTPSKSVFENAVSRKWVTAAFKSKKEMRVLWTCKWWTTVRQTQLQLLRIQMHVTLAVKYIWCWQLHTRAVG